MYNQIIVINKSITEVSDEKEGKYQLQIKGLFFRLKNKFYNSVHVTFSYDPCFDIVIKKEDIAPFMQGYISKKRMRGDFSENSAKSHKSQKNESGIIYCDNHEIIINKSILSGIELPFSPFIPALITVCPPNYDIIKINKKLLHAYYRQTMQDNWSMSLVHDFSNLGIEGVKNEEIDLNKSLSEIYYKNLEKFQNQNDRLIIENNFLTNLKEFTVNYSYKAANGRESSIELYETDLIRLEPKLYLNDKIILFYLRFLENDITPGRFIILDTYFYQKLSMNEEGNLESELISYNSVKKWTKNYNVFNTDYIIIPINENEHWSLLIVCDPGKMSNFFLDNNINLPLQNEENKTYPFLIYLDSFYEENIHCINIFKKYLFYEYINKHLAAESNHINTVEMIKSNAEKLKHFSPKVPKQNNTFDCGIFLLSYAELFLYEPDFVITRLNKETSHDLSDWFKESFILNKRNEIKQLLIDLKEKDKNEIIQSFIQNRNGLLLNAYKQVNNIFY